MKAIFPTLGISILLAAAIAPERGWAASPGKPARTTPATTKPASPMKPPAPVKPAPAASAPETATGTLKLPYEEFTVALLNWVGPKMVTVNGKDGVASVEPGRYWLASWSVRLKDAGGRVWRADGGPQGQPHLAFRIAPGGTTGFRLATPLKATLAVDQVDTQFAFILHFDGTAGDRCSRVYVDGEQPPTPKLKIVDADGAPVETLDLKWGCGFLCRKTWTAPDGVKWPLKAIVEVDFGPFPVAAEPVALPREPAVTTPPMPSTPPMPVAP